METTDILLGLIALISLGGIGTTAWLVSTLKRSQDVRISNMSLESTPGAEVQTRVGEIRRAQLCKSVTIFIPDGKKPNGNDNFIRNYWHTNPACPDHNAGSRNRDQILSEFSGHKYSINTHRIS